MLYSSTVERIVSVFLAIILALSPVLIDECGAQPVFVKGGQAFVIDTECNNVRPTGAPHICSGVHVNFAIEQAIPTQNAQWATSRVRFAIFSDRVMGLHSLDPLLQPPTT